MLKWCFECVGGKKIAETVPNEVPLGSTNLNNSNSAPPWPTPRYKNEIMFIIPRRLEPGDIINVTGKLNDEPRILVARLVTGDSTPDYDNVPIQVETEFPEKFTVKYTKNGEENVVPGPHTGLIANEYIDKEFNFEFRFSGEDLLVLIFGREIYQTQLEHNLNEIKFISLSGDIKNVSVLEFKYLN